MLEKEMYHWFDELHTIVLRRIVRSGDHDTNPFTLERPRPERCNETNASEDRIEDITAIVSVVREFYA